MQPKVSILVPVYNVEKYLRKCMDSIVKQTLEDIEIICVNDGSKDTSLEILKEYAESDDRIVIIDKENGGYGMAMNVATDKAKGEYIGIVEPDDYVSLNMFEDLYSKAVENDLDFVKADFFEFKEDEKTGEIKKTLCKMTEGKDKYNVVFNPYDVPETFKYKKNTWAGIYKREFIEKNNIRYNETPGASYQDNGFWFQSFAFAERAMIVDTPYYVYRTDNPNSSVKNVSKVYATSVEYNYIREKIIKHPEKWEKFKGMFWYGKYYSCMTTLGRISDEYKKDYTKYISSEFKFGYEKGEIDRSAFDSLAWFNIELLMKAPMVYHYLHTLTGTKAMQNLKVHTYANPEIKKMVKKLKKGS